MRVGTGLLSQHSVWLQWSILVGLSLFVTAAAKGVGIPAALLVAPMLAAIAVALAETTVRIPPAPFIAAQGVIGCMIGHTIPLTVLDDLKLHWPHFTFGILAVIAASMAIGLWLARRGTLPGTTAIWGTSPGASTPMIVLSETHGGDPRLVAVMQQLRIAFVIAVAALVARLGGVPPGSGAVLAAAATPSPWFPSPALIPTIATLSLTVGASFLGHWLRLPGGSFLLPIAVAMTLHGTQWLPTELPPWLLALSYALVGWNVGLRFTRPLIAHAFVQLPVILGSIAALMAACLLIAAALVVFGGIDPLTAYLATSPGGADTIAIIAASSNVDVRFVVAMQTARLLVVLLVSPQLSRYVALRAMKAGAGDVTRE